MSRRKKIICVLIILLISGVGLFDNTDVVYAGCTKTCDKCNGLGTFGNSASASGTVNGFSYNSYVKTEGCWNCGGSGTKTVYYASSSPGSGQSYTSGSYTKGTGVIATSCTYPSHTHIYKAIPGAYHAEITLHHYNIIIILLLIRQSPIIY